MKTPQLHTVKSTARRMNTTVLIPFSPWVHTIFSCLWIVLLFLTWLYTRFWLFTMQKHPYFEKHSLSLQTRPVICFATIYDKMSLTHEFRMTILSTLNRIESRRFISEKISAELDIQMKKYDILSLSNAFSPRNRKNVFKMYEPWLHNGITSTNIPPKAESDIACWYKWQISIIFINSRTTIHK